MAADDLAREVVNVPEWGGDVTVRAMTGAERADFLAAIEGEQDMHADAKLVARCLIGDDGARLFGDHAALVGKNAQIISRLAKVAARLSGLGAAAVEGAEKN